MRIQILFSKTEAMRYTSHLDLQRALDRTFRRAEISLTYSQGYNPRPKIVLASPLPLGYTSEAEIVEVWLTEELNREDLLERLQDHAPPGIQFKTAEIVPQGAPKLPNRIIAAEYLAYLHEPCPDLENRVGRIISAESLIRERGRKTYDLRPLIENLSVETGPENGGQILFMRLADRPSATGRPDEILAALDLPPFSAKIKRVRLVPEGEG